MFNDIDWEKGVISSPLNELCSFFTKVISIWFSHSLLLFFNTFDVHESLMCKSPQCSLTLSMGRSKTLMATLLSIASILKGLQNGIFSSQNIGIIHLDLQIPSLKTIDV
jgi:hypothetical protein